MANVGNSGVAGAADMAGAAETAGIAGAGAEKLKERILSAARAAAQATEETAQQECAQIEGACAKQMEQAERQYARQRKEAADAVLERSRTNAELAARKQALFARREVLDRAFLQAYEALAALNESQRGAICMGMLRREAAGGETVIPSRADRAQMKENAAAYSDELKNAGKAPLTISGETADIEYGFLLRGAAYEKNCSFKALLDDVRAQEETGVAKILFG